MKKDFTEKSLRGQMENDPNLTDEQKEWVGYIQNKVLIEGRKHSSFWTNIGAKYFSTKIGPNYRRWIDYLLSIGELETNEIYKAADGSGFPKSYRVPSVAISTGVDKIIFQRQKIQPPKSKSVPPSVDVVFEFVTNNLKRLTVSAKLIETPDTIADAMTYDFCFNIFFGNFNLRYGQKCKRLYHAVIEMPKSGRSNLQLSNSPEQLYEYDVKSCHPVLMLDFFTDPNERARYSSLLEVDIYDGIAAVMEKPFIRYEVKETFLAAINATERDVATLKRNWVYQFFCEEFPIFTQQVLNSKTDMAVDLQNREAALMVQKLGKYCSENNIFWIPCHDGWMTTAKYEQQIASKVQELFLAECGFHISISKIDLLNKKSLSLSFSIPIASYVYGNATTPPLIEKDSSGTPAIVVEPNPWREAVDKWKNKNDPTLFQKDALERSEARKRQKEGAVRAKAKLEESNRLASQIRKIWNNKTHE